MIETILAGLGIATIAGQTIANAITDSKNIKIQKLTYKIKKLI